MRYKICLSYNGSAFCGWQIQNNAPSVQGTLQDALGTILRQDIQVVGAGRTDTDVNARNYIAHFDIETEADGTGVIQDTAQLCHKLNSLLPKAIAVHYIEAAPEDFHARFGATLREYKYYIHNSKDPFNDAFSWYCRFPLDIQSMNKACSYLTGIHDCSCFEKKGSDNTTSICNIYDARWEVISTNGEGGWKEIVFTVSANRFLRNMVRAIVGTMVDIGRGVHKPEYIIELFEKGNRSDAGQSVPGQALFLNRIEY